MRASRVWMLIASLFFIGAAWGANVGRMAVPERRGDQTARVDRGWYGSLPLDPSAAAEAYLARIPTEMRLRGEAYSRTRLIAFGLEVLTVLVATGIFCASGLAGHMRDLAARLTGRPFLKNLLVALLYFVALYAISMPSEVYGQYVRPHRAGFSDQSFAAWLGDDLTNWSVLTAFYLVAVVTIYELIRWRPRRWVGWAIGLYVVLRAIYTFASPTVIEPLTNRFRPLAEGPQRQLILALARANGIREAAVVVGDASRQSRVLNAHVSGFGATARISVDDTTLASTSTEMLSAVVAHEIGHFVLSHEVLWVVSDSLIMAAGLLLIAVGMRLFVGRFGSRWHILGIGDIASLPVFWALFVLWGFAALPLSNAVARAYERQADLFGLNASRAPHGMAEFMIHDADIARLQPTRLEYALFYTHPSDVERVRTAMQWRAEMAGAGPPALDLSGRHPRCDPAGEAGRP